jgi:hypothetical protein
MSRYTIFADVAGRLSLDASGGNRMTTAAVAVATADTAMLRELARPLPKWRDCTLANAEMVVRLLTENAASVAVASLTKDPQQWPRFWSAAKPLHEAIVAQDRKPAGFIKPANVVLFALLAHVYGIATGHAIRTNRGSRLLDYHGLEIVDRTIVCDTDLQGDENISVFKSFWKRSDSHHPRMAEAGFRFVTSDVIVATEQEEPLLMLADYAAGLAHSALIEDPGRLPLPVPHAEAKPLLEQLQQTGKLVLIDKPFDIQYLEVFGDALMAAADARAH